MKAGACRWSWFAIIFVLSMPFPSYGEEEAIPRDPFWPVGYEKPKPPELKEEKEAVAGFMKPGEDQRWPDLPVQGVSRGTGGIYFALIKDMGVVSAGDVVSLEKDGFWYHWHIDQISTGGIRARKLGISTDRATIPRPATPAGNGQLLKE